MPQQREERRARWTLSQQDVERLIAALKDALS